MKLLKNMVKRLTSPRLRMKLRHMREAVLFLPSALRYRRRVPHIMTPEQTVEAIINEGLSISRYGDGELNLMEGEGNGFCKPNDVLGRRLKDVIETPPAGLLVCFPGVLSTMKPLTEDARYFWRGHLRRRYPSWLRHLPHGRIGDSLCTRMWMVRHDRCHTECMINLWKRVWENRSLLIVEGEGSRLGVGNDLFAGACGVERIICPPKDAYNNYDEILHAVKQHGGGKLVLLALGQTATALAADICRLGMQALDVGHIDVEYEWYRHGYFTKQPLPGRAVNEAGGEYGDINDAGYSAEIVERVGI